MLTSMKLAFYCLLCQSLVLSFKFHQKINRHFNIGLTPLDNRDISFSNFEDVSKKDKHNYGINHFISEDFSNGMSSDMGKQLTNGLQTEDVFSRYVDERDLDSSEFTMEEVPTDFPKTNSLMSYVLQPSHTDRSRSKESERSISKESEHESRSKRYRASVADRIAHGFGKRSEVSNTKPSITDGQKLLLAKTRAILKTELLKRIIYNDDYDAFVTYLEAFNDQIPEPMKYRLNNEDGYAGKESLQIPLRSTKDPEEDDGFFSGTSYRAA